MTYICNGVTEKCEKMNCFVAKEHEWCDACRTSTKCASMKKRVKCIPVGIDLELPEDLWKI